MEEKPELIRKEIESKRKEYQERHRFWADKVLTQFGNANNFFILIGLALIGYLIKETEQIDKLQVSLKLSDIDFKTTILIWTIIFVFISTICGTITLLSRLYDLRLVRHITIVRLKSYSKKNSYKLLNSDYIDIKKDLKFPKFQIILFWKFLGSVIKNDYFLNDSEIANETKLKNKFFELRKRSLELGRFSWISFKWQIFWIILALIIYILYWKL